MEVAALTKYSLRYYAKEDKYYIEIRDDTYFELDKRIRRLKREVGLSGGTRTKNAVSSQTRIALLTAKKDSAQKYILVEEAEIPAGVRARPLYRMSGKVIDIFSADRQRFINLLARKHSNET